jgi:hypothetical protein
MKSSRRGYRSRLSCVKPPLCKGRWHGEAVTEGLSLAAAAAIFNQVAESSRSAESLRLTGRGLLLGSPEGDGVADGTLPARLRRPNSAIL